jgi:hypothetical protein
MKLKTFLDQADLNLRAMRFEVDGGTGNSWKFGINPEQFIEFAKADFQTGDTRGLVNALSNAKRAIDCQADSFLFSIGLQPDRLEKQLGKLGMQSVAFQNPDGNGPLKFRLLKELSIATPRIVNRFRRLRNLLEHEYKRPRHKDVSDAIDIAELFVQACRGRMRSAFECVWFGSGKLKVNKEWSFEKGFRVFYNGDENPSFEIFFLPSGWRLSSMKQESARLKISAQDEGFVPLLKLLWHSDWDNEMTEPMRRFLVEIGYTLPKNFRVRRDLDF